jgi:hypothetical protein
MQNNQFNPGDKVTWTEVIPKGHGFQFSVRHGKFVKLADNQISALVEKRGKQYWVKVSELRREGEMSALGEAVMGK